ncbi:hypothetical protein M3Y99_00750200 [Aphelenchoides fujianensis]|nr:hypothetical protein M3Y99_00750200 [Aphelenchoides fujianensis]
MSPDPAQAFSSVETEIVSVERLEEFINIERESIWSKPSTKKPLETIPRARRSGSSAERERARKTSLTSVLFRLVEPFDGTIRIANVDIRDCGTNLRRLLTVIPQFDDQELWAALRKAHLHDYVVGLSGQLDSEITEGGTNLSVGQRQLVFGARPFAHDGGPRARRGDGCRKRVNAGLPLVLVDAETDRLIQETIRTSFSSCTILTIAHRLHTIMDYDKVLVMDAGRVREFDAIDRLLNEFIECNRFLFALLG